MLLPLCKTKEERKGGREGGIGVSIDDGNGRDPASPPCLASHFLHPIDVPVAHTSATGGRGKDESTGSGCKGY